MDLRSFVPGLAPPGKRQFWIQGKRGYREWGNRFEPQHRQRVRIYLDGDWADGLYNRDTRLFWLRSGGGWIELRPDDVALWTQQPPWPMPDPDVAQLGG